MPHSLSASFRVFQNLLAALSRQDAPQPEDWQAVLDAAVQLVPGVDIGTLNIREGGSFVLVAQRGFDSAVLGARFSEMSSLRWYGGERDAWLQGRPRVLRGAEVLSHARASNLAEGGPAGDLVERVGRIHELRATLCLPVTVGERVQAHLNLDALRGTEVAADDFGDEAVALGAAFAALVSSLLQGRQRSQGLREAARLGQQLLDAEDLGEVPARLRDLGRRMLGCEVVWREGARQPLPGAQLVLPFGEATPGGDRAASGLIEVYRSQPLSPSERGLVELWLQTGLSAFARLARERERAGALLALRGELRRGELLLALSQALQGVHSAQQVVDRTREVVGGLHGLRVRGLGLYRPGPPPWLGPHSGVVLPPAAMERLAGGESGVFRLGGELLLLIPLPADAAGRRVWAHYHDELHDDPSRPPAEISDMLRAVASTVLMALQRVEATADARAARDTALLSVGLALEARGFEVQGHTERVVALAERFGRWLELPDPQLQELRQGAYLHDLGKVTVPDAVMIAGESRSAADWRLLQAHTERGFELAQRTHSLPEGALAVIRHHHERYDGRGYPHGLRGQEIPLLARVFAIVDTYDAVTHPRRPRLAWANELAQAEIARQGGSFFDPALVAAFLDMVRAGESQAPDFDLDLGLD